MAKKKNFTPQEQERIKKRIEFVQANPQLDPAEARKRFFVQTRVGELTAAGKEVDRKALRQQFTSGNVKRKGFYTEGDLQRIAASKATTKKTTTETTTSDKTKKSNVAGPNVRVGVGKKAVGGASQPQNLAEYKLDRTKNANTLGEEFRYMKEKGFYKTALGQIGPDGKMTPLAAGLAKIGKVTVDSLESMAATFTNPAVNLIGKAFGKNPNLREAGPKEAAINTALAIGDIVTGGATRGASAALKFTPKQTVTRSVIEKGSAALSKSGFASQSARLDALSKVLKAGDEALVSGRGLVAPGKSVGPKGPGKNMSSYKNLAEGRGLTYRGATKAEGPQLPGVKPTKPKTSSKPKASTKPKATTKKTSQAKLQAAADKKIEAGLKNIETPAPAAPKPVAKKATTKKATTKKAPAKTQEFSEMVSSDVRQAPARKTGDVVTIGESKFVAGKTESGLPSYTRVKSETPAPVAKPVAKKATSKPSKAKMKRSFKERTQAVVNQSSSGLPKSFESQESYNTWLSKGGKEQLRNATQQQRDVFFSANRSFVEGKGAQNAAQRAAIAKKAARKQRTAAKYKKARPEVRARYNKLVTYAETQAANRLARMRGIK